MEFKEFKILLFLGWLVSILFGVFCNLFFAAVWQKKWAQSSLWLNSLSSFTVTESELHISRDGDSTLRLATVATDVHVYAVLVDVRYTEQSQWSYVQPHSANITVGSVLCSGIWKVNTLVGQVHQHKILFVFLYLFGFGRKQYIMCRHHRIYKNKGEVYRLSLWKKLGPCFSALMCSKSWTEVWTEEAMSLCHIWAELKWNEICWR